MTIYHPASTPWQLEETEFPAEAPMAERARFLVRYALLAPSTHNSQPWNFSLHNQTIHCLADDSRWLKITDEDRRELQISIGCALENLLVAAEHFGLDHNSRRFPDPAHKNLVAAVQLGERGVRSEKRPPELFDAITERHTNRRVYSDEPVPPQHRKALADVTVDEHAGLRLFDNPDQLEAIEQLTVEADMHQFADPEWRRELGEWIGRGAFGTSWLMSKLARLAVTHVDLGASTARRDAGAVRSAPLFAVITSANADPSARVFAGQALQRLWLRATLLGVAVHPMNQLLQVPDTRRQFVEKLNLDHPPQVVVRLGHATPQRNHTPRRPLSEVLV